MATPPQRTTASKRAFVVRGLQRLGVVLCVCAGLVWVFVQSGQASWREKRTIVVETPTGEISASGVWEHTMHDNRGVWIPEARGVGTTSRGEAIPLEVAPGKWLFVLFGGDRANQIVPQDLDSQGGVHGYARLLNDTIGEVKLATNPKGEPLRFGMVTFLDIDDPTSARFIENGDIEPFFGPGYRIVSSTVEITNEPVTEGRVIEVLNWWMDYRAGPYNEMDYLKIPDDSKRGWRILASDRFWSHDLHQEMTQQWEKKHANP
jgi:hypothetical protein